MINEFSKLLKTVELARYVTAERGSVRAKEVLVIVDAGKK